MLLFHPVSYLFLASMTAAYYIHSPKIIHQFSNPTWVENLYFRSANELLLTSIYPGPTLYSVSPFNASAPAVTVYNFTAQSKIALTGVTEVAKDEFYVVGMNFSLSPYDLGEGTASVFAIDLQGWCAADGPVGKDRVRNIANLTTSGLLNGMATLSVEKSLVVLADSIKGALWVLNVQTGDFSILLQGDTLAAPANSTNPLGVNGVRVLSISASEVYIYFSNTARTTFNRVPFSLDAMATSGDVEVLINDTGSGIDDFGLDPGRGAAYLAIGGENTIKRVGLDGQGLVAVLGGQNETIVEGATSAAAGPDGRIYITTDGGLASAINGFTEGGRVVAS